ncbi:hypothetical protein WA538_002557 [Blastocystis sp. DL]
MVVLESIVAILLDVVRLEACFTPVSFSISCTHPGYFGKVGMRHFHLNREAYYCPAMNLDEVWSLVPEEVKEQAAKDTTKAPVIDLTQHGVFKLLGRGHIDRPIVVKTKFVSSIAEKKIKAAGGACILTA